MDAYLLLVILLFALATTDLVVGVSNDAVNFLNSAIGSKVAPRHIILTVASLGIICGAMFSSGMMEVARKGIFNPEMFTFAEVMIIFLAVMLTDIVLLDLFNTFGMPTSTTVSIVFELMGAALAVSILKISAAGMSFDELITFINTSKATQIIAGIFISVGIAFTVGAIVQFFSRLLFSFRYKERLNKIGPFWGGISLAILSFFLIGKGLNGSNLISLNASIWISRNGFLLVTFSAIFWTGVLFLITRFTQFNILRLIVFAGTFSLAMAFANNDLVNFIGVPVAGFASFQQWRDSGNSVDEFMMTALGGQVPTPSILLLLAGVIMVITLWKSKKAQTVTDTEVNLSSEQEDTREKFQSHQVARIIVYSFINIYNAVTSFVPKGIKEKVRESFDKSEQVKRKNKPAFDLVRASVNLTTASLLIAIATSMKLPLSTTYVSFMVAMGTSLADRAWGQKSAVARVSGVVNVIGGWFLTALIALTVSGLFALVIHQFNFAGVIGLVILVIVLIMNSMRIHSRKLAESSQEEKESDKSLETA